MAELKKAGCEVVEIAGVMPNPTIEKVLEGAHTARKENVDFILGVGGGSTIDYCKAVAGSAWYDGDPWEYYFKNWQPMTPLDSRGLCAHNGRHRFRDGQLFSHLQPLGESQVVL